MSTLFLGGLMKFQDFSDTRDGKAGYMNQILAFLGQRPPAGLRVLDIPAGSGVFADGLERIGYDVVKADTHGKAGFVYANMDKPLPMKDGEFGVVTCLEGIEHVANPVGLIKELIRVTTRDGAIIISTPNITNLHSRLQFLFTGTFFQFDARNVRQIRGTLTDRGRVSPFTPLHLIYLFGAYGCKIVDIRVDRAKQKALIPLYFLMKPLSRFWTRRIVEGTQPDAYPGVRFVEPLLTGFKLMFGRSQILIFQKID